jgi:O-antigen ligase
MRERAGSVALGAALVVSALGFGGQPFAVLVSAALLSGVAALLLAQRVERSPRVLWLALALTLYTVFQLVPLPLFVVRWLSPAAAEVWVGALDPLQEAPPTWVTLSVDPSATALEVLKGSAYCCLILAAAGAVAAWGVTWVAALVFGSACLVALVTLAHGLLDFQRIYGLYVPPNLADRFVRGPFVNGNNLSAYLNLGLFTGAGIWAAGRYHASRLVPPLGIPLLVASVLLSGSRGGVVALALSGVVLAIVVVRQFGVRLPIAIGGAVLVGGIGLAAFAALGDERLLAGLLELGLSGKVAGWRWSLPMLEDFPVFGVGRGAFETAFPPYRGSFEHDWSAVFTHAENLPIDWALEWGLLPVLAIVAFTAKSARRWLRNARRDPAIAGILLGIAALLVHSLVDFAVELFAVGAAFCVALSVIDVSERASADRPVLMRWAPPALLALSVVLVFAFGARPIREDRVRMAKAVASVDRSRSVAVLELTTEIRTMMLRHPGEPYFPLLGAHLAARTQRDPMPWLARSLERGPRYGAVHLALADTLRARKRGAQALMHLRLAARYDSTMRGVALSRAVAWAKSLPELVAAFPHGSEGGGLFHELCSLVAVERQVDCWREATRREPNDPRIATSFASALLDALEAKRSPCVADKVDTCAVELTTAARVVAEHFAGFRPDYYRARLMAAQGNVKGAVELMVAACPVATEAAECLERAQDLAARSGDIDLLSRAAERRLSLVCSQPAPCADAHAQTASLFSERGVHVAALKHYRAAADADSTSARWLLAAEAAIRSNAPSAARTALDRARRSTSGEADESRIRELETRLVSGLGP